MTTVLAIVGTVAGIASLVFLAVQTRVQRAAAELTFNLQIMERLDDVLLRIADDPAAFSDIWSPEPPDLVENGRSHTLVQSLIDPVDMALCAVDRLPSFRRNAADWRAYARYLLDRSGAVRREVSANAVWWPHLAKQLDAPRS